MPFQETNVQEHPTYLMAQFNRVNSGNPPVFFGTTFKPNHYMELTFYPAKSSVDGFGEVYHSRTGRAPVLRVRMTPSQFAELLTTMNVGEGVPVTWVEDKGVRLKQVEEDVQPNRVDHAIERAKQQMREQTAEHIAKNQDLLNKIEESKLPKDLKKQVMEALKDNNLRLDDNATFYMRQIKNAGEVTLTEIKSNFDAVITGTMAKLGEKALLQKINEGQVVAPNNELLIGGDGGDL